MAVKRLLLDDLGEVVLYKKRGLKAIRLSIRPDGELRVSLPAYVPYETAISFIRTKRDWIQKHREPLAATLEQAQAIGKLHRIRFTRSFESSTVKSRTRGVEINVLYPSILEVDDPAVQTVAQTACIRALRSEAEDLLPKRVQAIAAQTGFEFRSVVIKKLSGRWGSCDQDHNIVLNLFLMQLPWELVDYVILHELVHTQQLHHGPDFWELFLRHEPRAKQLRKQIRGYRPSLNTSVIQSN